MQAEPTGLDRQLAHHPLGQAEVPEVADQAAVQLDDVRRQALETLQVGRVAPEVVDRDAVAPLPVFGDRHRQPRRITEAVVGEFQHDAVRRQPAAGQHALEHMPVVIGHRADQLGMHVEGQETPALLPLEEEVEGVERAHRAVEVHQLVVVAGLEKDRLGRHAPGVSGDDLQMRLVADHPCLALPHDRLEQGPQHTAGKTQPHPPIDDLEAFPAGARSGQTPALVEVMDEFGERHDGSP